MDSRGESPGGQLHPGQDRLYPGPGSLIAEACHSVSEAVDCQSIFKTHVQSALSAVGFVASVLGPPSHNRSALSILPPPAGQSVTSYRCIARLKTLSGQQPTHGTEACYAASNTRVPNRRIGGSGTSTKGEMHRLCTESSQSGLRDFLDFRCFGFVTPDLHRQDVGYLHFSISLVPNRRIGGSGALTRVKLSYPASSIGTDFSPADIIQFWDSRFGGMQFTFLGVLCLVWFKSLIPEPAPTEGHTSKMHLSLQRKCRHRRKSSTFQAYRAAAETDTRIEGTTMGRLFGLCIVLVASVLWSYSPGAHDDVWIEHQAASVGLCTLGGLGASILCIGLRLLGFGLSPLGRLVLSIFGNISPDLAVGFGKSFQVQRASEPAIRPKHLRKGTATGCKSGIVFRLLGVCLGLLGFPSSLAVQPLPPLRVPLAIACLLYPGGAYAMTSPESEYDWIGAPGRLRPHELPVHRLVHHSGPSILWPQEWQILRGEPDGAPPKIKAFDEAKNPGIYKTPSGDVVRWLGALVYTPNLRPVPVALKEF